MTETEKKISNPARIVILVLLGITILAGTLLLALNVMTYVQMQNAMKWSPDTEITQEDKVRYAGLAMIPEMTDYVGSVYSRGIRDPQYCILTVPFGSLEELYAALPYDSDSDRETALAAMVGPSTDLPEFPEEVVFGNAYPAEDLPVTETDGEGYVVSYYYTHVNYIIETADGYCLVFFVQTI